jgi:2-hydroxychromene-2-carboxylate isomerase
MTAVDFYFDVMCPWAYQTSRWIREVRTVRDVEVRWRFFSLEEVNREEGKKHPWEREWSYGWSMLRVAARLRREEDEAAVDAFYAAAGRALHEDGVKVHTPEGVAAVLGGIGRDPKLVRRAIDDPTTHEEVLADHRHLLGLGGYGVPTLVIDGCQTFFGPVVTPAPEGEAAGRLWDAVAAWTEFPHLYELRRPKTPADWAHIESQFRPYLQARDWRTVETPVP